MSKKLEINECGLYHELKLISMNELTKRGGGGGRTLDIAKGVGGEPWILPKSYLDPKYSSKVTQKSISKLSK